MYNVAILIGTLRTESLSRKMANAVLRLPTPTLKPSLVEIGNLSLYNEDVDALPPDAWTQFREQVKDAAADWSGPFD